MMRYVSLARWVLLGGVLAFGVATSTTDLRSAPAPDPTNKDEPKKDEPKKDEPKKVVPDDFPFAPLPDLQFPPGFEPPDFQKFQDEIKKSHEELRKRIAEMQQNPFVSPLTLSGAERKPRENRLGAVVHAPAPALVDQLDLPKDQGVVIQEVKENSAGGKAGLKPNDILLELDGKSVPSKVDDFAKILNDIKPDAAVDATVLRKGKKETVKGIKLPEVKAEEPEPSPFQLPRIQIQPLRPGAGALPGLQGGLAPGADHSSIQMIRTGDNFTTRYRNNNESIALTGKMADGKAVVTDITVSDGKDTKKFKSVDDVPESARDQVKSLLKMTEKGTALTIDPDKKP
jgi:membrane-associated protease RseP (regulator of RpoE activity)